MKRGTKGAWGSEFDVVERNVGGNVSAYRRKKGLTQEQLALTVGLEVKTLQRIEYGYGNCTARVLAALALALDTTIDSLFVDSELHPRKRGRPKKEQK
jgi:transcriptional regulator with XRE-family HTH domain